MSNSMADTGRDLEINVETASAPELHKSLLSNNTLDAPKSDQTELDSALARLETVLVFLGLNQSTVLKTLLAWFVFLWLGAAVPAVTLWATSCTDCHKVQVIKFELMIQISDTGLAAVSMLCMAYYIRKYGLQRLLFLDQTRHPLVRFPLDFQSQFRVAHSHKSHILTNPGVLKSIVEKADMRESDTVLEIGPGTGNLTLELLQAAHRVITVEIDPRMIEVVHKRIKGTEMAQRLELVRGDILRTDLPTFDICVANIPYQISSPLIFKLLSTMPKFRSATLMLQKEFGHRLVAKPVDSLFNRLAVNVDLLASTKLLMDVSKRHFTPCPKVDSSVVRIEPRAWPPPVDLSEWNRFTLMCFTRKNKTLGAIFLFINFNLEGIYPCYCLFAPQDYLL